MNLTVKKIRTSFFYSFYSFQIKRLLCPFFVKSSLLIHLISYTPTILIFSLSISCFYMHKIYICVFQLIVQFYTKEVESWYRGAFMMYVIGYATFFLSEVNMYCFSNISEFFTKNSNCVTVEVLMTEWFTCTFPFSRVGCIRKLFLLVPNRNRIHSNTAVDTGKFHSFEKLFIHINWIKNTN